jgi:adenylate kinase family enzyme
MERAWVVGNSGSGKTTLARRVAAALGVEPVELDAIFHQPGWTELRREEFRHRVEELAGRPRWVIDGNYSAVADLIWARADTLVWIDLPRWRVMSQLAKRTLSRGVRRTELWNGNRETLRNFVRLDKEKSILVWAWTQHEMYRRRFLQVMEQGRPDLKVVRLGSPQEVAAFGPPAACATEDKTEDPAADPTTPPPAPPTSWSST